MFHVHTAEATIQTQQYQMNEEAFHDLLELVQGDVPPLPTHPVEIILRKWQLPLLMFQQALHLHAFW